MFDNPRVIVLRFGELFLKGGNRAFFEQRLQKNVKRAVATLPEAKVHKLHARVLVEVPEELAERALERLGLVFGVISLSPARVVPKEIDALSAEAVRFAQEAAAKHVSATGKRPTFKVETKRSDKRFPMASPEISRLVGGHIHQATELPVDVHHPDIEVGIEIGPERAFVYAERIPGPGGLPVGVTGKVNLLISGGIDSPCAGWLAMKRGCTLIATYFHSFPYTGDRTKEKVIELLKWLAPWQGQIELFVVHFTDVQKALRENGPAELAVVLYRRMMIRTAAEISRRERALALVTGENLGQVASQTLENLAVIEEAAKIPVFRPLLTNDKLETIALAKRIHTYETSIQPYEDCCSLFVPEHPATKARLEDVLRAEARHDVAAMAAMLADNAERIVVR
ncbi:MAG: tRNA 4-thiouridine(8) synthase ThiI [Deltaproteobacteria bacterium]|nr:tRNA 4-thiouridine(8) synthase ThiI [Deltaproteobacteria bacterium]